MEVHSDFDARNVTRNVAIAVSNLHDRTLSSDSENDETPLVRANEKVNEINMSGTTTEKEDSSYLVLRKGSKWSNYMPARYMLTLMGFLGFFNVYALRVNLSVAMVAMVNGTAVYNNNKSVSYECGRTNETNEIKEGEFVWSPNTQATILGSFFYGYLVTQLPGGRLAEVFGGKWLFGLGVLSTSLLTLLTPVVARLGVTALIILRVLEGLGEGVTFPAMHAMLGVWLPKLERSRLSTIVYTGSLIGTVVAMPISALLCDSDFLGGWPSVFYLTGLVGCIWFVFWTWLIYESPERHPRITTEELALIQLEKNLDKPKNVPPVPWRQILTSIPVWTLVITQFGFNWGFYTYVTELPTYLSTVLHYDMKSNGFLSALPYLLQAVVSWVTSYVADTFRQRQYFSINTIRKTCNSIGFFGPGICLLGVVFSGCDDASILPLLILAMGFNGTIYSGYMVTHIDMSPDFAGTLMGIANTFATISGFLAPQVVGILTQDQQTLHQWQYVFYIAAGIYFSTGLLFIACGTAKLQKWGVSSQNKKQIDKYSF